jgi:hypothetical protein
MEPERGTDTVKNSNGSTTLGLTVHSTVPPPPPLLTSRSGWSRRPGGAHAGPPPAAASPLPRNDDI